MIRPQKQFTELLGGTVSVNAATQIAWNWFLAGVKHGSGKRIPQTDFNYLHSMMKSAKCSWKRYDVLKTIGNQ